jgi:hypothetical protein
MTTKLVSQFNDFTMREEFETLESSHPDDLKVGDCVSANKGVSNG